jgi:hypothetical protein
MEGGEKGEREAIFELGMCRTYGAGHLNAPCTQRSRVGLTSDAPTALQRRDGGDIKAVKI